MKINLIFQATILLYSVHTFSFLFKRSDTKQRLTGDYWKSTSITSSFSDTAINQQLSFLGFSQKRNIQGWQDWYADNKDSFVMDPKVIVLHSPLTRFIAVFVISILMIFLVPVGGILFCTCRFCCNGCGGRKPNEDGYSNGALLTVFGIFIIFALLNVIFGAINISVSSKIPGLISIIHDGIDQTFDDTITIGYETINGLEFVPTIALDFVKSLVWNLTTVSIPDLVEKDVGPVVHMIIKDLHDLGVMTNRTKSDFRLTISSLEELINTLESIPSELSDIRKKVVNLEIITVQNVSYDLSSDFPDTSELDSVTVPDFDNSVFNNTSKQVDSIPDPAEYSDKLDTMYRNLRLNITTMINSSVINNLPNSSSIGQNLFGNLNRSLSSQFVQNIHDIKSTVDTYYNMAATYDRTASMGLQAYVGLVIIPIILSMFGPFIKRRWIMFPYPVCVIIGSSLIWLLFILFYSFGAPTAIICNSTGSIINDNYVLTKYLGHSSNNFTASLYDTPINPQRILDSCTDGRKLYDIELNEAGDTPLNLLISAANDYINSSDSLLSKKSLHKQVNLSSIINQLNQAGNISFNSVNLTALQPPALQFNVNITDTVNNLNETVSAFTPETLDPDRGSDVKLGSKINDFNAAVSSLNPTFANWTYNYIVINYVQNLQVFNASVATQLPENDPRNIPINSLWYDPSDGVYVRASFYYYAEIALDQLKERVYEICLELEDLQENKIEHSMDLYGQFANQTSVVINEVYGLEKQVQVLINDTKLIGNASYTLLDELIDTVTLQLTSGIKDLITDVFVNNPESSFGECKLISQDIEFMLNGICIGLLDEISGLWYSFLLLGIFLIFGFVTVMMARKRVQFLREEMDMKGDAEKFSDVKESNVMEDPSIIKSAPIEKRKFEVSLDSKSRKIPNLYDEDEDF